MKVGITLLILTAIAYGIVFGWISHLFGLDNLSGPFYGFWSGVGSGSPLFALGAVYLRHHNCHIKGCWRLQWKTVPGPQGHVVCKRHHPHDAPTHEQVLQDHKEFLNRHTGGAE